MIDTKILNYMSSCEFININPNKSKFGSVNLNKWQITSLTQMIKQKKKLINDDILDDEYELRKII